MRNFVTAIVSALFLISCGPSAPGSSDDDTIKSAESAGPASLAKDATITDLQGNVLREGTNGWTCIPDDEAAEGTNPWCFNDAWGKVRAALGAGTVPEFDTVGIAYMLAGDAPVSNTDPAATEFTTASDWVTGLGSHLMLVVPGENALKGYSTDAYNGGPWIMWPGTPYEHLMVPIDSFGGK